MANIISAKKKNRQIKRRTIVNGMRLSAVRTHLKKVEEAIASGNKESAMAAFLCAQPKLMRGAQKGVVNRNMAARKISRLSARIKAMAA